MSLNSREAGNDAVVLELHKLQRTAEVRKASNRLQSVVGIVPGARLMNDQAVQLWEMPQKPKSFMQAFQEIHPRAYVGDVAQEYKVGHEGESGTTVRGPSTQTIKTSSASATQSKSGIELPQITVTDVDGSSLGDLAASPYQQQEEQSHFLPPISPSAQPASPPISFAQPPSPKDRNPVYWDWLLSRRINEWLDDETTLSIQTELGSLTLNDTLYKAQDFEKLKLTRLTIPSEADTERSRNPALAGPPEQRDWFVFEAQHKNVVFAGMKVDGEGEPIADGQREDERDPENYPEDYWLLAFPVCAVVDMEDRKSVVVGEQVTKWKVGREGFVPTVHGRGVEYEFLKDFVNAFAAGMGKIEFVSEWKVFGGSALL